MGLYLEHAGRGVLGIQTTLSYMGRSRHMETCLRKLEKENMSHRHHRGREYMMEQGSQSTEEWCLLGAIPHLI